jgi:YHS domain-containing protein
MDAVAPARGKIALGDLRSVLYGLLAALGLLAFYLSIITLTQSWTHALEQLADDAGYVAALTAGFGTQVGLFTYLRALHSGARSGGVVASTGTSTTAMLACCAHHLTEIAPFLGLSGLVVFLNAYKVPLLWLGIGMNLIGIALLLRKVRRARHMACESVAKSETMTSRVQDHTRGGEVSMERDPVCGMDVDPKTTTLKSEYMGRTYYFCAPGCKHEFERDPAKYAGKEMEHGGHHH